MPTELVESEVTLMIYVIHTAIQVDEEFKQRQAYVLLFSHQC